MKHCCGMKTKLLGQDRDLNCSLMESNPSTPRKNLLSPLKCIGGRSLLIWGACVSRRFFQAAVLSIFLYGCITWTLTKQMEKSLTVTTQECCEQYWTSPGGNTPQSSSYTATYHPLQKLSKLDEPDMQDTAKEVGRSL